MAPTINRSRLLIILLCVVIVIMMVQNYFLVRKNDELVKRVERLIDETNRQAIMQGGDSVRPFAVMKLDSTFVVIDPTMKGKKLFLVFTTWCHACLQNMPEWTKLLKEIPRGDLNIVGLSSDLPYKIKEYRSKVNLSFPVYSTANDSTMMKKYKLLLVPQTILMDSSGLVIKVWPGVLSNEAKEEIKRAI